MRFSFKKLFSEGQIVELGDNWSARFEARLAPVAYEPDPEDGPMPTVVLQVVLLRNDVRLTSYEVIDGSFQFPKKTPQKLREKLFKLQNDALDIADDDDKLDDIWEKELKSTWPPARKEWILQC